MNKSQSIGVVGLGNMGAAIARCLLQNGFTINVWNRNVDKMRSLIASGANGTQSLQEMFARSSTVFICVTDYVAADRVLSEAVNARLLVGKTVVQLSSMTPDQAEVQSRLSNTNGARFLAGGILTAPSLVGDKAAVIVYSGDEPAFVENQALFLALAGASQYYGEDPKSAIAAYLTSGTYIIGVQNLFYETAVAARNNGLALKHYSKLIRMIESESSDAISHGLELERSGSFDKTDANVELLLSFMRDAHSLISKGNRCEMTNAIIKQLEALVHKGSMHEDLSVMLI